MDTCPSMPEKERKKGKKPRTKDEKRGILEKKREQALQIYMSTDGAISVSSLAKRVVATRDSIARWKVKYKWVEKLESIRHERDKMTAEKLAGKLSDEYTSAIEDILQNYKAIRAIIRTKFSAKAPDGTPMRSADGSLMLNTALTPGDCKNLEQTLTNIAKSMRLLTNQSTDNQAINFVGQVNHTYCAASEVITQAVGRALLPGGYEDQHKITSMLALFQEMKASSTVKTAPLK
jgi:hypothetical protein